MKKSLFNLFSIAQPPFLLPSLSLSSPPFSLPSLLRPPVHLPTHHAIFTPYLDPSIPPSLRTLLFSLSSTPSFQLFLQKTG